MDLRAWGDRRRQRQEEGYEQLIVKMAREIVDPSTSPDRRERARACLLNSCAMIGAYHSLNATALYLGAIKRAQQVESSNREGSDRATGKPVALEGTTE